MNCLHCNESLEISYHTADFVSKVYHCEDCDRWFEIRKEKPLPNAAVGVMVSEIEAPVSDALPKAA